MRTDDNDAGAIVGKNPVGRIQGAARIDDDAGRVGAFDAACGQT
jgi:hypothetical protein